MTDVLERAVEAYRKNSTAEGVTAWLATELALERAARAKRARREYQKAVKIEGQHFTVLKVEASNVEGFLARVELRHIASRRRAVVHMREDGEFGVLNWKG